MQVLHFKEGVSVQVAQLMYKEEQRAHWLVAGFRKYWEPVSHWQTPTPPTKTKVSMQVPQEVLLEQVMQVEGQTLQVATGYTPV
jgi:hypothetical protein